MTISPENLRFFLSLDGLGGPITSTEIGDSLFPDVRGVEAERGLTDYRCLYFINTDDDPDGLIDVRLWFNRAVNDSELLIGVDPAGKNGQAQRIRTAIDVPIDVRFSSPLNDVMPLFLPGTTYNQNDYVALWLKRVVSKGSPPQTEKFILRVKGESF